MLRADDAERSPPRRALARHHGLERRIDAARCQGHEMTLPPNEWMPVFAIVARARNRGGRRAGARRPPSTGDDGLERVGTAWREDDGSYLVSLATMPAGGELLIRPPRHGDPLHVVPRGEGAVRALVPLDAGG